VLEIKLASKNNLVKNTYTITKLVD